MDEKRNNSKGSWLDDSIRRLLISNPSLDIDKCRKILQSLSCKTEEEKELICANLQQSVVLYKKKAKEISTKLQYNEICSQVKSHISQWEAAYGKVSLSDILSLTESTNIPLSEIGDEVLHPNAIAEMLDEYLIGQNGYSQKLALTVYAHMLRTKGNDVRMPKSNLLVYGPSGVGKTYGIQILAKKLGIPFGIVNCNVIVTEGIVGEKIRDKLTQMYIENGSLSNAILFFDEFDKLFTEGGVYNFRLLEELLLFLDDDNTISYPMSYRNDSNYLHISSRNITCILGGKFDTLKSAARKRLALNAVGFTLNTQEKMSDEQVYECVNKEDIRKVLGSDELFGRIGHFVRLKEMTPEMLVYILLYARESPLDTFRNYFSHHGIRLLVTEEGAREIAQTVSRRMVGVRGLKSTLWHLLEQEMLDVDSGMRIICVDKKYVQERLL